MKETKRQNSCILLFSLLIAVLSICFPLFFGVNSTYAQQVDTLTFGWSPPELDSTVSYYKIYRSVDTSDYDSIGTTSDTTYFFMGSMGHTYRVKVSAVNSFGIEGALSEASPDTILRSGVDEAQDEKIPKTLSLDQNFPNPFNPSTTIRYQLPAVSDQRSAVSLKIYNILGQEVRILVDEEQVPGYYRVIWDGRNSLGRGVSGGVYYYQLRCGSFIRTRRMIFLK